MDELTHIAAGTAFDDGPRPRMTTAQRGVLTRVQ